MKDKIINKILSAKFLIAVIFCLVVWGTVTNGATNWIGYKGNG